MFLAMGWNRLWPIEHASLLLAFERRCTSACEVTVFEASVWIPTRRWSGASSAILYHGPCGERNVMAMNAQYCPVLLGSESPFWPSKSTIQPGLCGNGRLKPVSGMHEIWRPVVRNTLCFCRFRCTLNKFETKPRLPRGLAWHASQIQFSQIKR